MSIFFLFLAILSLFIAIPPMLAVSLVGLKRTRPGALKYALGGLVFFTVFLSLGVISK